MNYRYFFDKKIKIIFPDIQNQKYVSNELSKYGNDEWEKEIDRVRLSILKCSNGNLEEIKRLVAIAKKDYRDVIAMSEYPNQLQQGFTADKDLNSRLIKEDKKQFKDWLET